MKRRWNALVWTGFLFVLFGLMSYIPIFALFPITRDFPWVNLLCFAAGLVLLGLGLHRAFRQPSLYRGRVSGPILTVLSVAGIGLFSYGLFYLARQLPPAAQAPRVGQKAPDFTLPDQNAKPTTLAELIAPAPGGGSAGVPAKASGALLIFYRGHW